MALGFNRSMFRLFFLLPLLILLSGCFGTGGKTVRPSEFDIRSVAKTDIDLVAEIHQREAFAHLRALMEKLYKRNPQEWKKSDPTGWEPIVARVFELRHNWMFKEMGNKQGAEALHLAFQEDFQGDRVLAFIGGLGGMVFGAYGNRYEFYAMDEIDPQHLYNSARNVEVAVWKLSHARNSKGELFLVSNGLTDSQANLSFEREFGKLIAEQDTLARIVAEKTNRGIAKIAQNLATAVFLPISLLK